MEAEVNSEIACYIYDDDDDDVVDDYNDNNN